MGRVSVPIMNKSGYSMYWNSIWDDKLNYTRSLKDGIFLKEFMYLFFEGGSYSTLFFNLSLFQKKFEYLNKKYFFHTIKFIKKNNFKYKSGYLIKRKKGFKPYLSKIWILKYQTWIIIYFYSYSFNLSIFFKKVINYKKNFKKYSNILTKYSNSVFKIKYNYKHFSKFLNTNLNYF